jgi:hypothetical protein
LAIRDRHHERHIKKPLNTTKTSISMIARAAVKAHPVVDA